MSILDMETNAAYARQRTAELRAMSSERYYGSAVISRRRAFDSLRVKIGVALIALGERLSGVSVSRRTVASPSRASSY